MQTIYAKGGRKTATTRVYLSTTQGEGKIEINKTPLEQYFTNKINIITIKRPLEILKNAEGVNPEETYNISLFIKGGGTTGQAESARHAIAHALAQLGEPYKAAMKAEKLLTRDDRQVERKKPGLPKARATKQWTKR